MASGVRLKARVAKAIQGVVANFKEPNAKPGDFHVNIDWGDQSAVSQGRVRLKGKGRFTSTAPHRYAAPGTFTVRVTIIDAAGVTTTAQSFVRVSK